MTIPPIAVESAKEAAHRLLELTMSDAPPLDRDTVRSHALDVIEALTDDPEPDEDDPDENPFAGHIAEAVSRCACPPEGPCEDYPEAETGACCTECVQHEWTPGCLQEFATVEVAP